MALVHQRVQRVIFGIPNEKFGALGGASELHLIKSLNHRYRVFRVSFSEQDFLDYLSREIKMGTSSVNNSV